MSPRSSAPNIPLADHKVWRVLAWAGVALQLAALISVLWFQRWSGSLSISVFLAISIAFLLAQDRIASLLDLLVVCATILNGFGWAWNFFDHFVWFDEVVHFATSFAVTAALADFLRKYGVIRSPPGSIGFVLWLAALGFGLGALWELAEALFLDLKWPDTLSDLIFDSLGAVLAAPMLAWLAAPRER